MSNTQEVKDTATATTTITIASPAFVAPVGWRKLVREEDWLANWTGLSLVSLVAIAVSSGYKESVFLPAKWSTDGFVEGFPSLSYGIGLLVMAVVLTVALSLVQTLQRSKKLPITAPLRTYLPSFFIIWVLAFLSHWVGRQKVLSQYGLGYALWSLLFGMLIANLIPGGAPKWMKVASMESIYIKTGLVLLGIDLLTFVRVGGPGLIVGYLIPPIVLAVMWQMGRRWLHISSNTLIITLAAGTSICGNSAATAIAASCQAPKEELALVIGLLTVFTTIFMIAQPYFAILVGIPQAVAGAWIGGSVDATGQVIAAGAIVGETAEVMAGVVKILQNTLIGFFAVGVATYWVTVMESEKELSKGDGDKRDEEQGTELDEMVEIPLDKEGEEKPRPTEEGTAPERRSLIVAPPPATHPTEPVSITAPISSTPLATPTPKKPSRLMQIWARFPVFTLGFLLHSVIITAILSPAMGAADTKIVMQNTKNLSSWLFSIAFVSIGLDTNFRQLAKKLKGGKIIGLYLLGQLFDCAITLGAAYLAFSGALWPIPDLQG